MSDRSSESYTRADLEREELELQFDRFTREHAIELGLVFLEMAREEDHAIAIGIELGAQRVFRLGMPGTSADHDHWLERKFAAVRHFDRSSMELEMRSSEIPTYVIDRALDAADMVLVGGAFPLRVGDATIGVAGVAGLRSIDDHRFTVAAIRRYLDRLATRG